MLVQVLVVVLGLSLRSLGNPHKQAPQGLTGASAPESECVAPGHCYSSCDCSIGSECHTPDSHPHRTSQTRYADGQPSAPPASTDACVHSSDTKGCVCATCGETHTGRSCSEEGGEVCRITESCRKSGTDTEHVQTVADRPKVSEITVGMLLVAASAFGYSCLGCVYEKLVTSEGPGVSHTAVSRVCSRRNLGGNGRNTAFHET